MMEKNSERYTVPMYEIPIKKNLEELELAHEPSITPSPEALDAALLSAEELLDARVHELAASDIPITDEDTYIVTALKLAKHNAAEKRYKLDPLQQDMTIRLLSYVFSKQEDRYISTQLKDSKIKKDLLNTYAAVKFLQISNLEKS